MSLQRNAGFTSAIATNPADTAAGYLTPARFNLPDVVSGADVGGIPYCPTATSEVTSANFRWMADVTAGQGLIMAAGTATTDVAALSLTRTNNTAAVATGVKWTFTDTTSAAGFLPFQILGGAAGTTNLLRVDKSGVLIIPDGTLGQPAYVFNANTQTGIYYDTNTVNIGISGTRAFAAGDTAFGVPSNSIYFYLGASADATISRLAAGSLAIGTGSGSFAGRLKLTSTIAAGVAVGSLNASPTTGEIQSVTDALAPVIGNAVAAGGAAKALVWYNGAQWTVVSI